LQGTDRTPQSFLLCRDGSYIPWKGADLMCIAVPAEVIEKREGNTGIVDYGDLRQEVRLDLVDVEIGEFVLVHVGFAIQKLSREEGLETREIFRQVYAALEEEAPKTPSS
jgi:hydrogenase expression/formation protein HypC